MLSRSAQIKLTVILIVLTTLAAGTARATPAAHESEGVAPAVATMAPTREGGDTCGQATMVPGLPYSSTGNTCQFEHNYDEVCPFAGSTSPDVVYKYTPADDVAVDITLCNGSTYDTKLYVYENMCPGPVVGCSDDDCPGELSELIGLNLFAGHTYYIVVDGFAGQCGDYHLDITAPDLWGACCHDPGAGLREQWECTLRFKTACEVLGDSFDGSNTCDPNPCPWPYPGPGVDCDEPIEATYVGEPLEYSDASTCTFKNTYDGTCVAPYDQGDDIHYQIHNSEPEPQEVVITLDPQGETGTGLLLYDSCPPSTDNCIAESTDESGLPHGFSALLMPGDNFLMIDSFFDCIPHANLSITPAVRGACCVPPGATAEQYTCVADQFKLVCEGSPPLGLGGTWQGAGTSCDPNPCPWPYPGPGVDCDEPIEATYVGEPLEYSDASTCTFKNTYDGTCVAPYDQGDDIHYQIHNSEPEPQEVVITLDPQGETGTGLLLYDSCPPSTDNCIAESTDESGLPHGFSALLQPGDNFLMIDSFFDCIPHANLSITPAVRGACCVPPGATAEQYTCVADQFKLVCEGSPPLGLGGTWQGAGTSCDPNPCPWPYPGPGVDCDEPIEATYVGEPLEYSDASTCTFKNTYDGTCVAPYDQGDDIHYQIHNSEPEPQEVVITLDPQGETGTGLLLYDSCPPSTDNCIAESTDESGLPHGFSALLMPGDNFLMIDSFFDCIPHANLSITPAVRGACCVPPGATAEQYTCVADQFKLVCEGSPPLGLGGTWQGAGTSCDPNPCPWPYPGPGVDCDEPIEATYVGEPLEYSDASTCTFKDTYDGTCVAPYDQGDDIHYQIHNSEPEPQEVVITLDPQGETGTGLLLYDSCPPSTDNCIAESTDESGLPHGFSALLQPGDNFLMIDSFFDCIPHANLSITPAVRGACCVPPGATAEQYTCVADQFKLVCEGSPPLGLGGTWQGAGTSCDPNPCPWPYPGPGVDCDEPIEATYVGEPLEYSDASTCTFKNTYDGTCVAPYDQGDDIHYQIHNSEPEPQEVVITLDPQGETGTGLLLYDSCPPSTDNCIAESTDESGLPHGFSALLMPGDNFLMIDSFFDCIPHANLSITPAVRGACCVPPGATAEQYTCVADQFKLVCEGSPPLGLGGTWQGAGTSCDPNPCPWPYPGPGVDCDEPIEATYVGEPLEYSDASTCTFKNTYDGTCVAPYDQGDDIHYQIHNSEPEPQEVVITLDPQGETGTGLLLYDSCPPSTDNCIAESTDESGLPHGFSALLMPGDNFLMIDSFFDCIPHANLSITPAVRGACCVPPGATAEQYTCVADQFKLVCEGSPPLGLGGTWQGAGTSCDPNPCPWPYPGPGVDCDEPIEATYVGEPLEYSDASTCTFKNTYDGTCVAPYDQGDDIHYQIHNSEPEPQEVVITLDPQGETGTGLLLYDSCPPSTDNCIAESTDESGLPHGFSALLQPGDNFLMIDSFFDCIPHANLSITPAVRGACCVPPGATAEQYTCVADQFKLVCEGSPPLGLGGTWQGAGTSCDPNPCPWPYPGPGVDCDEPIEATYVGEPLEYSDASTCTFKNTYDGTCIAPYDQGDDIHYQIHNSEPEPQEVVITLDPQGETGTGLLLYDSCPPSTDNCIAESTDESGLPHGFSALLMPGDNFLMIDSLQGCMTEFDLTIAPMMADADGDGVPDTVDNCWEVFNPEQLDSNGDCPGPPYAADPVCGDACECPEDTSGNGNVGPEDLADVLGSWGPYAPCPPYKNTDFDEDCLVGPADLAQVLGNWGPCP